MKYIATLFFIAFAAAVFADGMLESGRVKVVNDSVLVDGEMLFVTRRYDGKRVSLDNERLISAVGKNPGFYLSMYWDKSTPSQKSTTQHLIILDATGTTVRFSNSLDSGLDFVWGDNNYVQFERYAMYFGIYDPQRKQFVYRDGKLEENKGPWRGPAEPEKYLEPDEPGPCYNVANVPACLAEVEEAEAAERAKKNRNVKPPVRKTRPSATK